jgi:5-methylcytosine-specific restriction endonuclease McrA
MTGGRPRPSRGRRYRSKWRPKVPQELENSILVRSRHQCCICHSFDVQIAHADDDRNNNNEDNLIPLCGNCHNRASKRGGMTKGYTPKQLLMYKKKWFEDVEMANKVAALGPLLKIVSGEDALPTTLTESKSEVSK